MNRALHLVAALGMLAAASVSRTSAQEPPPPRPTPTVKLKLQPAVEPVPALKYALLPPFADRTPGNAAPLYYRTLLTLGSRYGRVKPIFDEQKFDWLERPLADMPREEVREWLAGLAEPMREVHAGARREHCDWNLPIRGNVDLLNIQLEEIQESRMLTRILAQQARLQMLDGQYDEAIRTLQTSFALARHVNEVPLVIPALVATAMVSVTADRVLEFSQQPHAPSLYWALSALPVPVIDLTRSAEAEGMLAYQVFPFLYDARTADRTPEQWQAQLEGMTRRLGAWGGLEPLFGNEHERPANAPRLVLAALSMKGYPRAKRHLLDRGVPRETVERMPVGQAIAIYTADLHDEVRDELLKWQHMPWPEANQGMERAASPTSRRQEILPLISTLEPGYRSWIFASRRADRRIAELRVIEALRLYAGRHDRQLPAKLSDVTEVPIPIDPLTGKEFGYRLEGTTGILEVAMPPGYAWPIMGKRYEVTIADP